MIPKRIHYIWFGERDTGQSEEVYELMEYIEK